MIPVKKTRNILSALLAGVLNGLLGTGGGVALWFAVSAQKDRRTAFATASAGVLVLCLVSVFLYRENAATVSDTLVFSIWLALLGGALGAFLLRRLSLSLLRLIFSFLLIGSGSYSIIRTVYDVFFA